MATLDDYKDIYLDFIKASTRAHILATVAAYALDAFPDRLPEQTRNAVNKLHNDVLMALIQREVDRGRDIGDFVAGAVKRALDRGVDVKALVSDIVARWSQTLSQEVPSPQPRPSSPPSRTLLNHRRHLARARTR